MKWLCALSMLMWASQVCSQPQLDIKLNSVASSALKSDAPLRLSAVLAHLNPPASTYWPAAGFADLSRQSHIDNQRVQLIKQLDGLSQVWGAEPLKSAAAQALRQQLSSIPLLEKQFYSVDLDKVRLSLALDPVLAGSFSFYFPARPIDVKVMGVVKEAKFLAHQAHLQASDYLAAVLTFPIANTAAVTVIQPDGVIQRANTGYWLKSTTRIAPGAIVFVGFDELPEAYENLNDDISNLLRHHLYWWK